MSLEQLMIQKLTNSFNPQVLSLENESYKHRSSLTGSSHFKLILVSEQFNNQKMIARHRAVYSCLADELDTTVHALALHLYTPQEWQEKEAVIPNSPNCIGKPS
ncbi:BolA family protein [Phocoenobacter skyensis]|uniref:BolA protein n=1 Tax=Phocoenobacter skyensis TaxID=97481 RepID=A0A1H7W632_9PAST|nr:BolA/IbaG family iron-sulfur metabolism protein [Pasteurella skyensis]MDP8079122.1 BolA/IbaG family iron-sulfur metabolism protein [Pasteurella skyensis]MDP8085072.1 BolA/IbaG family iron-sulfur metabolism protein [Pasteurella skyensis]MDP8163025.1 BolA/IbaG family iron-sulfur metabolism protein [Pasteurella skyensis]MDP8173167.1 BolA/IbaG family iron-sulfur metabolism protein [Pasteurella skyensis]MDP8176389.1 BolA/IbaG family iron-sulfur metabolism protein [Pasteurella skyensis]